MSSLLALYLAVPLLIDLLPVTNTHDVARLLGSALLLTLLVFAQGEQPPRVPGRTLALCIGWASAASINAAQPTAAVRECVLMLGLSALAFTISCWRRRQLHLLARLMCIIGLLYGLMFCSTLATAVLLDGEVLPFAMVFGFDNPRHLAHTQTVLIPLAIGVAATAELRSVKWLGWLAATLAFTIAAFLVSRATLLSVGVAGLALIALLRQQSWPYLRLALSSMAIGVSVGLAVLLLFGVDLGAQFGNTQSGSNRLVLWRAAIDDAGQSLFGVGPMHFSRVQRGDAAHPHNAYLQVAAEFGWPAAIALVFGVLKGLSAMAKRVRRCAPGADRTWGMGLWVTLVAIAVDATLSGNFVMPLPQLWVFLAIGFALAWYREGHAPPAPRPGTRSLWAPIRYTIAAAMLALFCVSAWEFMQPVPHLMESRAMHLPNTEFFYPRFWRDGWF